MKPFLISLTALLISACASSTIHRTPAAVYGNVATVTGRYYRDYVEISAAPRILKSETLIVEAAEADDKTLVKTEEEIAQIPRTWIRIDTTNYILSSDGTNVRVDRRALPSMNGLVRLRYVFP